jgi:hypothetical protein
LTYHSLNRVSFQGRLWNVRVSEWLFFNATQQFFSYIMARTGNFQWDDTEVRFVQDQHA